MEFWGFLNAIYFVYRSKLQAKKSHEPPNLQSGPRDWHFVDKSSIKWPSACTDSQAETKGKRWSWELCSGHSQPKAHTLQRPPGSSTQGKCWKGTRCLLLLLIPDLRNPLQGNKHMRSPCSWLPRNTGSRRIWHHSFLLSQQSQSLEIPASLKLCRSGYQQDVKNFWCLHTDIFVSEHTSRTS